MNRVLTTEAQSNKTDRLCLCDSVLGGDSPSGSWSQCAIRESWGLSMNLAPVAAVCHRRPLGSWPVSRSFLNRELPMNRSPLPVFDHPLPATRGEGRERGPQPGSWPVNTSFLTRRLPMNLALWSAVGRPAGRPTAVQGRGAPEVHSVPIPRRHGARGAGFEPHSIRASAHDP